MSLNPIHENLNTSFVDLDALVRYLRSMQFVGRVSIELCAYEAEIIFTPLNTLQALERDLHSGAVTKGKEAFQRILERVRSSHGRIGVYRSAERTGWPVRREAFVESSIAAEAERIARSPGDSPAYHLIAAKEARQKETISIADSEHLLSEILTTMNVSLAKANLNFAAAFHNACLQLERAYPFLADNEEPVVFHGESASVSVNTDPAEFAEAVCKAIGKVFNRLAERPSLAKVHVYTKHRILYLIKTRRRQYERHGIYLPLKRAVE